MSFVGLITWNKGAPYVHNISHFLATHSDKNIATFNIMVIQSIFDNNADCWLLVGDGVPANYLYDNSPGSSGLATFYVCLFAWKYEQMIPGFFSKI